MTRSIRTPILPGLLALGAILAGRPATAADNPPLMPVGLAKVDVTPDTPIRLGGYGSRREESDGVAQKLWAKALVLGEDGNRSAVLITVDAIGIPDAVSEEVARRLAKKAGIERADLAICATHTHTGPYINGVVPHIFGEPIPRDHQEIIDRYTRNLIDALERVAIKALAARRPGRLHWAQGKVGFAVNRRLLSDGRWTGFGVNKEGPVDHALPLLRVTDADGRLRGLLVSYACHCTTFNGTFNRVHGDWAGVAQEVLESRYTDVVAMVAIGCGADANPIDRGDEAAARRNGQAIADEVARLLAGKLRPLTALPRTRLERIELPLERLPDRAAWEEMARQKGRAGYVARIVLERLDRGKTLPTAVPYVVQTWAFGDDLAMVFLAGEVVVDYSLRLKKELDGARLWVNAYANDIPCYIASERLLREGGYEVEQSMYSYDRLARLSRAAEDRIIAAVKQQLPASYFAREGKDRKP